MAVPENDQRADPQPAQPNGKAKINPQIAATTAEPDTAYFGIGDAVLLRTINQLFDAKVDRLVQLPQLVVVGDQSSGKSSLLHALTGLPFPRSAGTCTRFPTHVKFTRARETRVSISIDGRGDEDHNERMRAWSNPDIGALDPQIFADQIARARAHMGIDDVDVNGVRRTFSRDVLVVEIRQPNLDHFSVIDVPGIVHFSKNHGRDVQLIQDMIREYLENPRSIILAVIPATGDPETNQILDLVTKYDTAGERSLGVFTKPDRVGREEEHLYINLIDGTTCIRNLEWYVVRNPDQRELDTVEDRDKLEADFFDTVKPWNDLSKDKVGINSLRDRLKEILPEKIRNEFENVLQEIDAQYKDTEAKLSKIGPIRISARDCREHLKMLSDNFQGVVERVLGGNAPDEIAADWFAVAPFANYATTFALRTKVMRSMLESHGHTYAFEVLDTLKRPANPIYWKKANRKLEEGVERLTVCKIANPEPAYKKYKDHRLPTEPKSGIVNWLEERYKSSEQLKLVPYDDALICRIMREQSVEWGWIASGYTVDLISMSNSFIESLLRSLCSDKGLCDNLLRVLKPRLEELYEDALKYAEDLFLDEQQGTIMTLNDNFAATLQKRQRERLHTLLRANSMIFKTADGRESVPLKDILHLQYDSNDSHIVHEIHDILDAYYTVALTRFSDNVFRKVGGALFTSGRNAPLRLFSSSFIHNLTDEKILQIARETSKTTRDRARLLDKKAKLERAKEIMQLAQIS